MPALSVVESKPLPLSVVDSKPLPVEHPGFIESLKKTVIDESPLNPANWIPMVKQAFESPFSDANFAEARREADLFEGKTKPAPVTKEEVPGMAGAAVGTAINTGLGYLFGRGLMKVPEVAARAAGPVEDAAAAVASPEVQDKLIKMIPKGQSYLEARDAFRAARDAAKKTRTAGPPPVLRDANSPAWAQNPTPVIQPPPEFTPIPAQALPSGRVPGPVSAPPVARTPPAWMTAETPAPAPAAAPVEPAPAALPSGRKPGGIQNQQPITEKVASIAAKANEDAALHEDLAQSLAGKSFKKLTKSAQDVVRQIAARGTQAPAQAAAAPQAVASQAAPATAPSAQAVAVAPDTAIRDMMRLVPDEAQRAEFIRQRNVGDSAPRAVADGMYAKGNLTSKQAGKVYEAAARADKAVKLADAIHEGIAGGKFEYSDVLKMGDDEWKMLSDSLGINKPSKATIGEVLFRLQRKAGGK